MAPFFPGSHPGPAADVDTYAIAQAPGASYEVLVDMGSGDLGAAGPVLERFDTATSAVVQVSAPVGIGHARVLRWQNLSTAVVAGEQVRVRSGECTTDCGTDDQYRLRVLETTLRAPRFNNVGSQVTVVQVQNTTEGAVAATLWFWSADGSLLGSHPLALPPFGSVTVNTSTLPGLAGSVALEPATGRTFETAIEPRPR